MSLITFSKSVKICLSQGRQRGRVRQTGISWWEAKMVKAKSQPENILIREAQNGKSVSEMVNSHHLVFKLKLNNQPCAKATIKGFSSSTTVSQFPSKLIDE